MNLIFRWLLNALALAIVTWIVPGFSYESIVDLLIAAAVLGLLNAIIKPILFWLTLPITILSLGLFLIVLNALMLELTDWLIDGFEVRGFVQALIGAIVLSLVTMVTNRIGPDPDARKRKKQ